MLRSPPVSGLPLLFYKLRTGGVPWLADRLRREWQMPTSRGGQAIYRALRRAGRWGSSEATLRPAANDALYAFYDLAVAPLTFDFLWFLVGAELARRRVGASGIHVVIVPGRDAGVRREDPTYEAFIDPAGRWQRIVNILLPACSLLPSVTGTTVASDRGTVEALVRANKDAVFPARYEPGLPIYPNSKEPLRAAREDGVQIGVLRATAPDLRLVERWLAARGCGARTVTITLRHYDFMPARNSNLAAWSAFARGLDPKEFSVVFVPDTEQCFDGMPGEISGFPVCSEAAVNLGLRMALYERAYLNLGINNGPMGLCWLNERARYLTFKMLTEGVPQATSAYMASLGFEFGTSLPSATPWQKWVWEDDDRAVIEREFAMMVEAIERSGSGVVPSS
jgi:hypothetical protein